MASVRSLHLALGGDLKGVFSHVKQNLSLDVREINSLADICIWQHNESGKITINGLTNPVSDSTTFIPGVNESNVSLTPPTEIASNNNDELLVWLEERYQKIINVSNGTQDCLYVGIWLPLWDKALTADVLNLLKLMDSQHETSTFCVDIFAFASDMLPVVCDDKEKISPEKRKGHEITTIENLRALSDEIKATSICRNLIVLQNKTIRGISLDLSVERLAALVEEVVVIYTEDNIKVFQSPRNAEVRGLGISILNFDKYYFTDRMLTKAYLYIMDRDGVHDDGADVAKLSQTVNSKLKEKFGDETKLFSHFWQNHIKKQLAEGKTPDDISKDTFSDITTYLQEIANEVVNFLQDNEFTLPEKRAGLASLFGEDDPLFKGIVYDNDLPTLDDCEVEQAQMFVDYHNEIVNNSEKFEDLNIADLPLSSHADEDGLVNLNVERIRQLKKQLTNTTQTIRRLEEEKSKAQGEIDSNELVNKVEVEDGKFVVKGKVYRFEPNPMDEKALEDFYELSGKALPASFSLKDGMSDVRNQGQIGSCTAHTSLAAFEYLARKAGEDLDLNEMFTYYKSRELQDLQNEDKGASIYHSVISLGQFGTCRDSDWTAPDQFTAPSAEAIEAAKQFTVTEAVSIKHDIQHFKDALASGYPVLMGFKIYPSFANAAATKGFVIMPTEEELAEGQFGWHAMLIVGYSDKENVFIVRNSWGTEFGDDGYCYVPYSYVECEDYYSPNSSFVIKKVSTEAEKTIETKPIKTSVNFNLKDAAIQYAIASVKLAEEQQRYAALQAEYSTARNHYLAIMSDIRDNARKQELEEKVRVLRQNTVEEAKEAAAKKEDEINKWQIEYDFVTAKKLTRLAIPVIAFLALTLLTFQFKVTDVPIAQLLYDICFVGIGVSVLLIARDIFLIAMKSKQSEEDKTTFGIKLPKARIISEGSMIILFIAALVVINWASDFVLSWWVLNTTLPEVPFTWLFGILWKIMAGITAITLIIGIIIWKLRAHNRRKELDNLNDELDQLIQREAEAENDVKLLHLRTFVAGTLHNQFYELKDTLRGYHNKLISFTNNLLEWYKAEVAHLASLSVPNKVPFINVIEDSVLDEYFEMNKDNLIEGMKLSDFVESYKVDEKSITKFKYLLKQQIMAKIFEVCEDFNMSDYLMEKMKYEYLPKMTSEKRKEFMDMMNHRSQVFLQINGAAAINTQEVRFFMINTSGLSSEQNWRSEMMNRFITNASDVIGTELRHCAVMVNLLETTIDGLVISRSNHTSNFPS